MAATNARFAPWTLAVLVELLLARRASVARCAEALRIEASDALRRQGRCRGSPTSLCAGTERTVQACHRRRNTGAASATGSPTQKGLWSGGSV